jgi:hypothetical protein
MRYKIKEVYTSKGGKITVETLYGNYKEAVADLTELFNNREKSGTTELMLIGIEDGIVLYTKTIYRRE